MAAPAVSAIAAELFLNAPQSSPETIKQIIMDSAIRASSSYPELTSSTVTGARVNLRTALELLRSARGAENL